MAWYQKPKQPAEQVVPPGMCVICGESGSIHLSGASVLDAQSATPRSLWICHRCADERRGNSESN